MYSQFSVLKLRSRAFVACNKIKMSSLIRNVKMRELDILVDANGYNQFVNDENIIINRTRR